LQGDRDLCVVELRVGEVVEEVEDGPIGDQRLVVDADARPVAGLGRSTAASLAGDEAGITRLADAVERREDGLVARNGGELVPSARPVERTRAEAAARDSPHGRAAATAKLIALAGLCSCLTRASWLAAAAGLPGSSWLAAAAGLPGSSWLAAPAGLSGSAGLTRPPWLAARAGLSGSAGLTRPPWLA